jgi:hypothetical protein
MIAADKQLEIAKRGMDAAFSYTKAAVNAAFESNARVLGIVAQVADAMAVKVDAPEETWEWSGAPKRPHSTLFASDQQQSKPSNPLALWGEMLQSTTRFWFTGPPVPFGWWPGMPQSAVPATWPWAYGMIHSGVPASVAWPIAEGNAALFEAASRTVEAAQPAFPYCHSGNGFAVQVWSARAPLMRTFLASAPASAFIWPWLDRAA